MEIINNILLLLCIISIIVYVVTSKVEKLDLIDTSDNNPLISGIKNMKSGLDKLGDFVKMLDGGAQQVLGDIKKAFDPKPVVKDGCPDGWRDDGTVCWLDSYANGVGTIPPLNPCPDDSYDVAGTCWKHNYKNSWGKTDCNGPRRDPVDTWGSEGCDGPKNNPKCSYSWGCDFGFRNCRNDYHKTCWGWNDCYRSWNDCYTSDFPYVYKNIGDRGSNCGDKVDVNGLCYNRCRDGYHFVGGNICEPDGGIKRIELDARTRCPYEKHTKKVGVLCYQP